MTYFAPVTRLLLLVLMGLLVLPGEIFANVTATTSSWSVHVWQSSDGLPTNNIAGIAQSSDGYLEIGTSGGLTRFDGVQFDRVWLRHLPNVSNTRIRSTAAGLDGDLWMAMDDGVVVHLLRSGTAEALNTGLKHFPEEITVDKEGALWIGYNNGPVCKIKDGKQTLLDTNENVPAGRYTAITTDSNGRIWFSRAGRVGYFVNDRFKEVYRSSHQVTRMAPSPNGNMWICANIHLLRYTGSAQLQECGDLPTNNPSSDSTVLREDPMGAVWIGTDYTGLFRYDGKTIEPIPTSSLRITALMPDAEGNVWVGTGGGGLDRVHPRAVQIEGGDTGNSFSTLVSLTEDTNGKMWGVSGDGVLLTRNNNVWSPLPRTDLDGIIITAVHADDHGGIWVGTRSRRLTYILGDRIQHYGPSDGLAERNVDALLVAKNGDVWVSEERDEDAIQCMHDRQLSTIVLDPSIRHVHALAEDASGTIWAGSESGSILQIKDTNSRPKIIRPHASGIRTLHITPDGSVWIGYQNGLGRLKNGKFTRVTASEGLYDDNVHQILHDDRGWLWIGTDGGLFKVRQQQLDDLCDAPSPTAAKPVQSVRYGVDEELPHLQATSTASPGAIRTRDGRLWLPMGMAMAIVSPDKVHEHLTPPPVLVTHLTVDDQDPIDSAAPQFSSLSIAPDHRRIRIDFTALSLSAPENVRFKYQLEGFETNWNDTNTDRFAKYSRLTAGNYKFHVIACNDEGIWNEQGATLAFTVKPFFWQTWWFWTAAIAIFTTSVALVIRFVMFRRLRRRLQALEKQTTLDKERARIARDLHDDLGGSLTHVSLLLDLAQKTPPQQLNGQLGKISLAMSDVSESIDEIVWAINPKNDSLPNLINYLGQYALEFLRAADIRCRFDLPEHPPKLPLTPDIRHNVFLVMKEALSNVVRHADATEVHITMMINDLHISLSIEDNGKGLATDITHAPEADGLRNMQQRLHEIHGTLTISSIPYGGTRITLQFPTPQLT